MDSGAKVKPDPRRSLPSVDRLLAQLAAHRAELSDWALGAGARWALSEAREHLAQLAPTQRAACIAALPERALSEARRVARAHPVCVVNATGIVLHTNLGRAPLAEGAALELARAARRYVDLEIDLASGARRSRSAAVEEKLRLASGAAGALVVNNNAAALLLLLAALARGREVIVSRGELVEIGGAFRIPEIAEAAGVRLVEVGTTNRTHVGDYERAIGPETALLLKVHRSNFELRGFVSEAPLPELASLGRARGLPVVEDLGSAALVDLSALGFPAESYAPARLAAGADLVCFSGDKLLGGPQAGIVLGRDAESTSRLARHPLARALRVDKLTLAALDWTLAAHLRGTAVHEVPALRALLAPVQTLERRARELAERLRAALPREARVGVEEERGFAGGGSLPGFALAAWVVTIRAPGGAERLARRLRLATPPVLARVRDANVLLDVRTLLEGDEKALETAVREALR